MKSLPESVSSGSVVAPQLPNEDGGLLKYTTPSIGCHASLSDVALAIHVKSLHPTVRTQGYLSVVVAKIERRLLDEYESKSKKPARGRKRARAEDEPPSDDGEPRKMLLNLRFACPFAKNDMTP